MRGLHIILGENTHTDMQAYKHKHAFTHKYHHIYRDTCPHTYIWIKKDIYTHTDKHKYTETHTYPNIYMACTHTYMACTHIYKWLYKSANNVHTHKCTHNTCAYAHSQYTPLYMHIYTHTHLSIHVYTYTHKSIHMKS